MCFLWIFKGSIRFTNIPCVFFGYLKSQSGLKIYLCFLWIFKGSVRLKNIPCVFIGYLKGQSGLHIFRVFSLDLSRVSPILCDLKGQSRLFWQHTVFCFYRLNVFTNDLSYFDYKIAIYYFLNLKTQFKKQALNCGYALKK